MEKTPKPRKPMLVRPLNSKVPKGYVTVDWDIRLKKSLVKKKMDELVESLLAYVGSHAFKDNQQTASLKFQLFKSVDNPLLYNLKVYRTMKETLNQEADNQPAPEVAAIEGPTKTSGPKIPPPPKTEAAEIVAPQV